MPENVIFWHFFMEGGPFLQGTGGFALRIQAENGIFLDEFAFGLIFLQEWEI